MALDSLASWLVEGSPGIEAELAGPGPAAQITAIFQAHAVQSDVEGVAHMLDALIKMLKQGSKITVRLRLICQMYVCPELSTVMHIVPLAQFCTACLGLCAFQVLSVHWG